jgi:hypothetical protein
MSGSPPVTPWSVEQVLTLAPDPSAQRAARGLSGPGPWRDPGWLPGEGVIWGLCQGSGSQPYQTCVDVSGPAFRCSCPSRKIPCKHALALLLRWATGALPAGPLPAWVAEWLAAREDRAARAQVRQDAATEPVDEQTAQRRAASAARTVARRAERITAGLEELDRWLADQLRRGLAAATRLGYGHWDTMAARLVDAQAPAAASSVRRLAWFAVNGSPERLLAELALLRLLVAAHRRLDTLPAPLAATVRTRVGYPVATEDVLATEPVRDDWQVLGVRDEIDEYLATRRVWLRGVATGRSALVLSFAGPGQTLAADLVLGTAVDADLHFYPGAQPLRALVGAKHAPATPDQASTGGMRIAEMLREYAQSLAGDPWLDRWPVLLNAVAPVRNGSRWRLVDEAGDGVRLLTGAVQPWRLLAASGGQPVRLAGEWTPDGLRALTVWAEGRPAGL